MLLEAGNKFNVGANGWGGVRFLISWVNGMATTKPNGSNQNTNRGYI